MSSSPSVVRPVLSMRDLHIDTGIPTVEIFVLDGGSRIVARGVGSISATLPEGMYKVRFRVGTRVTDGYFELPPGDGGFTPPQLPPLPLATPVPLIAPDGQSPGQLLESTSANADLAMSWSMLPDKSLGSGGSSLFLFVDATAAQAEWSSLASMVTVRGFDGADLVSLHDGKSDRGCLGCTIELAPGSYVLTVDRGAFERVSQAIYCVAGWQTEVFLPVVEDRPSLRRIDPSAASILMSPSSYGFRADSKSVLWAEAALKTLASGRAHVTPASALRNMPSIGPYDPMIEGMLYGKFLNPMLGLYGAHLMALEDSPDNRDVLEEVVPNLRQLLGDIPDVMALVLHLDASQAAGLVLPQPPMLASSWAMIVQASVASPAIVPVDSPAGRVASRQWGAGAWLGWQSSALYSDPPATIDAATIDAATIDWELLARSVAGPAFDVLSYGVAPTAAERAVLSYVSAHTNRYSPLANEPRISPFAFDIAGDPNAVDKVLAAMPSATGIPSSVLQMAAADLTAKLKGTP